MRRLFKSFLYFSLLIGLSSCGNPQQFNLAPEAERFQGNATYNNKVDLLWVVDNSRSMTTHQNNLSKQFSSFIDLLNAKGIDYRIGVSTMDMSASGEKGKFIGTPAVLNPQTPNIRNLFKQRVQIGEAGSDVERGFEAMMKSISPERIANENQGFLREDAFLAIIFVTNEDDFSSGKASDYAEDLDNLKGFSKLGDRQWMANFIGITAPNGTCFTRGDIADPGDRYMDLVKQSGGQVSEICSDDLSQALANVRIRIIEKLAEFRLGREPVINSIKVYVNGVLVPNDPVNGWTYDPQGFIVKFHGNAVPAADAIVRIDYQPVKPK